MAAIVLSTLNARYVHASLGLRCLLANLGDLQGEATIAEFVLGARPADIVETLLKESPRVVGFGVYIWNVEEVTRVAAMLKTVAPEVVVVVGGPEASHEVEAQRICRLADHVITGWGEVSFAKLCRGILSGHAPLQKVIAGEQPPLDDLVPPYRHYTGEDIRRRFLYVEASRGCPFKCEFCLSSLDRSAWPFDIERFLGEMRSLHERGARHFRFVDRTFNLNVRSSLRILEFFLDRIEARIGGDMFLHFEVIPDHLPEKLRHAIARFPKGTLHLEIGIQTFNPAVQALISRRQDDAAAEENFRWLREHSNALIHADLIAGLPGEDLESFGRGFDRLHAWGPHEIQLGILKRLRGTPIARHTETHALRFNPDPPYNVLATGSIGFADMQRISRFARYWDLIANSGRFPRSLPLLLGTAPFARFMEFADWVFATTGKTHEFALERLYELQFDYLTARRGVAREAAIAALGADYESGGARGRPAFLDRGPAQREAPRKPAGRSPLRQVRRRD